MPGWKLVDTHPTQGRTFRRPLDATELSFLWDSRSNGVLDIMQHFQLRLSDGPRDQHLFSKEIIVSAWLSTKRRYPLAGATVQGEDGPLHLREAAHSDAEGKGWSGNDHDTGFASDPHFVVREHDLAVLRPNEIVFGQVSDAEDARHRATAILNGPRPLSDELLVKLYVFREADPTRHDVCHLITLMAHCMTDGVANITFVRCFLDTLARGGVLDSEPARIPLENRLAMAIPPVELEPVHLSSLSAARRRWRRAIGTVLVQLRMANRQGGHTLPCRITRSTPQVAARSGHVSVSLARAQSAAAIANCRLHGITFGNAYLVLAQVAMTRVLYRRYLRGEISEEEWAYRKRQPHLSGVPLNLRPYLDKTWFDGGGGGEFTLSLSFFYYQLPFMTLGDTEERYRPRRGGKNDQGCVPPDGAPPFSELLSFDRFLHRAGIVKKQSATYLSHPLFFEIVRAVGLARVERTRLGALQGMKRAETLENSDEVLAVKDMPQVWAHGGSTLGNLDRILPSEYPLPPAHPLSPHSSVSHPVKAGYVSTPSTRAPQSGSRACQGSKILVEDTMLRLHMHPAELYLGTASLRGQLNMYVLYDRNVFEDGVVKEWLDEMREAVLWYLCRTHRSCWIWEGIGGQCQVM